MIQGRPQGPEIRERWSVRRPGVSEEIYVRGSRSQPEPGQEALHPVNIPPSCRNIKKSDKDLHRITARLGPYHRYHPVKSMPPLLRTVVAARKTNHSTSEITCMYGDYPTNPVRQFRSVAKVRCRLLLVRNVKKTR